MQSKVDYECIVDTLTAFVFWKNPTKASIRNLVVKATKIELISKASPALRSFKDFRNLLKNFTGNHIGSIYELSKSTNAKVLQYLNVAYSDQHEEKAFDYLNHYINQIDKQVWRRF